MAIEIRSGGSTTKQQQFKTTVQAIIAEIGKTRTGKLVLDWLKKASYDVIIEPNLDPNGFNNAFERAASFVHSGNARLGKSARGTRSFVAFSPNRLTGKGVQFARHEVLLHELCHSLRTVYGQTRFDRLGGFLAMAGGFDTVEEFFAAMVTSVHSSELNRPALGNHGSWPLPSVDHLRKPPFNTRLRQFNVSMPDFCQDLRAIPPEVAPFNPFRDIAAPVEAKAA